MKQPTRSFTSRRSRSPHASWLTLLLGLTAVAACSNSMPGGDGVGGMPGGLPSGGTANGGSSSAAGGAPGGPAGGRPSSGGASVGGAAASGGAASGGGGANAGGASGTGGTETVGGGNSGGAATGGTAAGGSGSGGQGSAAFAPCPASEPCKVLPLGDSITFGLGFAGGYRVELFHLANEDGHDITFTGTQMPNGPDMVDGKPFSKKHEGISGQTIQQIAGRVPSPALTEMPHIILLHAGTNDTYQGFAGADSRLGALLDELIEAAPDSLLVVSNLIPYPGQANNVASLNAVVPGLVEERAEAGAHIVFVDQFTDFPTSELGDGIHPNQAGYARMAAKWYAAIEEYLP